MDTPDPKHGKTMLRAGRSVSAWIMVLSLLAFGLGGDLLSKKIAFEHVGGSSVTVDRERILNDNWHPPPTAHQVLIPKVIDFRLVVNRGAVFGIGPGQRWFFIAFTFFAVFVGLLVFALRTSARDHLSHMAIGLILAGALGNVYDRIVFAAVRDFLNLFPGVHLPFGLNWPGGNPDIFPWVFNVADVLLLCGIGLLMLRIHSTDRALHAARKAAQAEESAKATAQSAD